MSLGASHASALMVPQISAEEALDLLGPKRISRAQISHDFVHFHACFSIAIGFKVLLISMRSVTTGSRSGSVEIRSEL